MKRKNLSIIIPHFNSVALLGVLLDSIPMREDIEVIVIDDKSSAVALADYNRLSQAPSYRTCTFLHNTTQKKGAGVCRNLGLQQAEGEWVLFADADDYFTPTLYETIQRYFESAYEVVFFTPTSIYIDSREEADRHKRFCERLNHYTTTKTPKSELELRYKLDGPISKLIRRAFLVEHAIWFEEVLVSNDTLFSTRVGYHMKQFEIVNAVIYVITRSFNTLTVNPSEAVFDIRFREKIKYYHFLKARLSSDDLKRLNIAFLDYLFRARRYGVGKVMAVAKEVIAQRLPIIDKRLFTPSTLLGLFRVLQGIRRDQRYTPQ